MYQIQLLLSLYNNEGKAFPSSHYEKVKLFFNDKFGGITMYTRTSVVGLWKESPHSTVKDELIIYEILSDQLEKDFWQHYKSDLQSLFQQEEMVIKACEINLL